MKKIFWLMVLNFVFVIPSVSAQLIWFGKTMSAAEAQRRWGSEEFDAARFKKGDMPARAKMASSLIKHKNQWIGKSVQELKKSIGEHDGFYFTDTIPAYFITDAQKEGDEAWQIVFLPDNARNIKDVIIELNGSR